MDLEKNGYYLFYHQTAEKSSKREAGSELKDLHRNNKKTRSLKNNKNGKPVCLKPNEEEE